GKPSSSTSTRSRSASALLAASAAPSASTDAPWGVRSAPARMASVGERRSWTASWRTAGAAAACATGWRTSLPLIRLNQPGAGGDEVVVDMRSDLVDGGLLAGDQGGA